MLINHGFSTRKEILEAKKLLYERDSDTKRAFNIVLISSVTHKYPFWNKLLLQKIVFFNDFTGFEFRRNLRYLEMHTRHI